jgi:DNA-directed RNA polymerase specialized sigma24 family protein
VVLLRITAATADYAAAQLGNGLSPEAARVAAVEVAEELKAAAGSLRRLTRLGPAERRALAVELAEAGMSQREIAGRLGLSLRAVWGYLRHSTAVETP